MKADEFERKLLDLRTRVSMRALAEILGCAQQTVSTLTTEGRVIRAGRGRYLLRPSLLNVLAHLREQAGGRTSPEDGANLTNERALLAREQREGVRWKNAIQRGEYVRVEDVGAAVEREYTVVRERILAVPGKLAADLTSEQVELVRREITEALEDLQDAAGLTDRLDGPPSPFAESDDGEEPAAP